MSMSLLMESTSQWQTPATAGNISPTCCWLCLESVWGWIYICTSNCNIIMILMMRSILSGKLTGEDYDSWPISWLCISRAHKDVCKIELSEREKRLETQEYERRLLEEEVVRLKRAIQSGGVTEPHHDGDTPATPVPEYNGPTPHNQHEEERLRQEQEQHIKQQ